VITLQARRDAYRLGLDAQDVRVCIAVPELKQDVYQTRYDEFELYVKLQLRRHGPVVVVSFKLR
jgi:hypothetical protein